MQSTMGNEMSSLYNGYNADKLLSKKSKRMTATATFTEQGIPYVFGKGKTILVKLVNGPAYSYQQKSARWHRTDMTVRSGGVGLVSLLARMRNDDAHDLSDWYENEGQARYLKLKEVESVPPLVSH